MTNAFSWQTLLAFALLHFVLQGQICLLLQVSLDFLLLHSNPLWWKGWHLLLVLVLEGQLQFPQRYWLGIYLDNCDIELFALETNHDHSVVFETVLKYCILDIFVDYEGYSISSKAFLPTVVDTMVIWIKFAILVPFSSLISKMSMFTLAISCWSYPIYHDSWI